MATDSEKDLQEAINLIHLYGTSYRASKASGIPETTLRNRNDNGRKKGLKPSVEPTETEVAQLRRQVRDLKTDLRNIEVEQVDAVTIKKTILKLTNLSPSPPDWLIAPPKKNTLPGVPTLFFSDWHFSEIVVPEQVGGADNAYNIKICKKRARTTVSSAVDLLFNHVVNPKYPGIVLALGGDMFSGDDLHEEITETNETPILMAVVQMLDVMIWCLDALLDKFNNIFLPCVVGNHGRRTRKPRNKYRVFTNFDWMLYRLLERHYDKDKRVTFYISDSSDALYRIYDHRFLLTHGDQFFGGDGVIGPLGPIIRGDYRKRARNNQIDMEYDTMIMGHWHQLIQMSKIIVNGSLKGYDEYAYQKNLPFEKPQQALFLTTEKGITISMPVFAEHSNEKSSKEWVGVRK